MLSGLRTQNLFLVRMDSFIPVCPPGSWEPLQSPQFRQSPLLSDSNFSATGAHPARCLCSVSSACWGARAGVTGGGQVASGWARPGLGL